MTEIRDANGFLSDPRLKSALGRTDVDGAGLAHQVRDGLREPLGFPGFNKFLFSGDRVVLTVHAGINQIELVLHPLIDELLAGGGLESEQIKLLFADRESADRFSGTALSEHRSLACLVHEGMSDQSLALLGTDDGHSPVFINRLIFDADVLVPIIRAGDGWSDFTQPTLWDFVDSATKKKWRGQLFKHEESYSKQIADMAGVIIAVHVVVGPGDFPYGVLVGHSETAEPLAAKRMEEIWQIRAPEQVDVLVATIEDRRDRSSWQAIRDALVVATNIGKTFPIVIVSDVAAPPPNELRGVFSPSVSRGSAPSFDPALQSAVEGRTVYLCSKLDSEVVRDLGLKSIGGQEEIASLLSRFRHPVLLRDGQRAVDGRVRNAPEELRHPSESTEVSSPSLTELSEGDRVRKSRKGPKSPRKRKTSQSRSPRRKST